MVFFSHILSILGFVVIDDKTLRWVPYPVLCFHTFYPACGFLWLKIRYVKDLISYYVLTHITQNVGFCDWK